MKMQLWGGRGEWGERISDEWPKLEKGFEEKN
jgi:hypothetical protein